MPGIESYTRRDKDSPSPWAAKLEGANFQWARATIALMFDIAEEEGAQLGGRYCIKTNFFEALRPFLENPCLETAIALLNFERSLWSVFEQSKHPLIAPNLPASERTHATIQNGKLIPLIECGVSSIKLAIFTELCRKFREKYDAGRSVPLAFCVTHTIFCDPVREPSFRAFGESNFDLIGREIREVFADEELSDAVLLGYAARMIALGWETHNPLSPIATQLLEMATASNKEIPNLVQMWEEKAIITFFQRAQEFMRKTLT
jgi:hypothetical protein